MCEEDLKQIWFHVTPTFKQLLTRSAANRGEECYTKSRKIKHYANALDIVYGRIQFDILPIEWKMMIIMGSYCM